jgi:hypothetical protein
MVEQYIEQQNEVIRFLRERIKSFEDNAEDSISREREVSRIASTSVSKPPDTDIRSLNWSG